MQVRLSFLCFDGMVAGERWAGCLECLSCENFRVIAASIVHRPPDAFRSQAASLEIHLRFPFVFGLQVSGIVLGSPA